MRIRSFSHLTVLLATFSIQSWNAPGQVLSPAEIADPTLRSLQQSHLTELHAITKALEGHKFPYHFYFSRRLDLSEREQEQSDQRSIQFDNFRGQLVLKITGNYFAAYSAERMNKGDRARQSYLDVMLPILQAAAPALGGIQVPDAFALEVSHHVIRKVLGVDTESPENVVLILPKASAQRLIEARDEAARVAAVQEGTAYLNGVPVSFWPGPLLPEPAAGAVSSSPAVPLASAATTYTAKPSTNLDAEFHDIITTMLKELDSRAHFVPYAPPSFIAFRGGHYLQIAITTTLESGDAGSQYKLAALAFDRHVARLVRPVLAYFKNSADFSGIDFSTTVRLAGGTAENGGGTAVEFIFPLSTLRRYEQFDLTGQQLIDASIVLINGERVGLDLQSAEAAHRSPK